MWRILSSPPPPRPRATILLQQSHHPLATPPVPPSHAPPWFVWELRKVRACHGLGPRRVLGGAQRGGIVLKFMDSSHRSRVACQHEAHAARKLPALIRRRYIDQTAMASIGEISASHRGRQRGSTAAGQRDSPAAGQRGSTAAQQRLAAGQHGDVSAD